MHWRRKWQPTPVFCLENPRDGGAWWAAVYGVAQSRTRLKRLSSSIGLLCSGKESACNAGDLGSIPESGRSSGEGNGNPLQYSCLENSMDRGAWWATVHGVTKSQTRLRLTYTHRLPSGAASGRRNSSVLAELQTEYVILNMFLAPPIYLSRLLFSLLMLMDWPTRDLGTFLPSVSKGCLLFKTPGASVLWNSDFFLISADLRVNISQMYNNLL